MKLNLTLILLFIFQLAQAQDLLLFSDVKSETLIFSKSNLNGPSANTIQQMLNSIDPYQASFDLAYEYECRLIENNDVLKGDFLFNNLSVTRATQVQGFSFADLLLPVSANISIELLAEGSVVHRISEVINVENLNQAKINFNYTDIQPATNYTLAIKELYFNYNSASVQDVRKRKDGIDQYHSAKLDLEEIDKALASIEGIQLAPEQIPSFQSDLNGWQNQHNKIGNAHFWNSLELNAHQAYDPENIKALHQQTGQQLDNVQNWLDGLKANIHELYYEKGIRLYENKQIRAAQDAFKESIAHKRRYAPSHYFLAIIDFETGEIDDAADRVRRVLNDYRPDPRTEEGARALATDIMNIYISRGETALNNQLFSKALDHYEVAKTYGSSIHHFDYAQNELNNRIAAVYHTDFHSQLDHCLLLKKQGKYQLALEHLEQALAFQNRFAINSTFNTKRLYTELVTELFNAKMQTVNNTIASKNWDQALQEVGITEAFITQYAEFIEDRQQWDAIKNKVHEGKFEALYQQAVNSQEEGKLDQALNEAKKTLNFAVDKGMHINYENDSKSLIEHIQQARYQRFVRGGDRARNAQDFAAALEQYEEAKKLENSLTYIAHSPALQQKQKATALQEIKKIHASIMSYEADDNHKIERSFAKIKELSGRYHLTLEPAVKAIYQELEDQKCFNARDVLLPNLEQQASRLRTAKKYQDAKLALVEIQTLIASYPRCNLSSFTLDNYRDEINTCAQYQEILMSATEAEDRRQYRTALNNYLQAKELFNNKAIIAQQLKAHPAFDTYNYISNHPKTEVIFSGADLYLDQREHEQSLSLLKLLIQRGVRVKSTQSLQTRLGSALAVRYYMPTANWKTSFAGFITKSERKNYKALKKAFRKRWYRMS